MVSNNKRAYQSNHIFDEINTRKKGGEKMQCRDVKTIVKCVLFVFFFILEKKKSHVTQHQNCLLHPCCCLASKYIYIFIWRVVVNESKQAQRAGQRSDAAGGRAASFHPSPLTSPPSFRPRLSSHSVTGMGGLSSVFSSSSFFFPPL